MRIETAEITALAAAGILGRVRRVAGCRGCDQPRDLRVLYPECPRASSAAVIRREVLHLLWRLYGQRWPARS